MNTNSFNTLVKIIITAASTYKSLKTNSFKPQNNPMS